MATRKSAAQDKAAGKASGSASADELKSYYRDMLLIRRFEEKAGQLYGMGLIGGFCHLYIGQEAVVVGLEAAAEEGDKRVTSYRDHGHMLACGMDPDGVMAELTGREGGYSKGKGGSMHMFSKEKHFYGGHGIVGAQVPIGAGLAFADKYLDNNRVTFTYFGDGAANQGQVYETFNMAALWKLPVIFVIENNQYAMGTAQVRSTSSADLYKRGEAFGIPGELVDGMDVLAVKEAGEKAVTHERVRVMLLDGKHASEDDLKAIDKEIKDVVSKSADFAKDSPEPDPSELWTDIYARDSPQGAALETGDA